eukprot:scaffold270781_cov31-Tisochrysis_lutea.AAC.5
MPWYHAKSPCHRVLRTRALAAAVAVSLLGDMACSDDMQRHGRGRRGWGMSGPEHVAVVHRHTPISLKHQTYVAQTQMPRHRYASPWKPHLLKLAKIYEISL